MKNERFIPYGRQWIDENDIRAVCKVLRSDWITQGPRIREFEEQVAAYCGAKYGVAVSSGTAALHIACLAAGIQPGHEVICSPISFAASANCVVYCGGLPVFVDIESQTLNMNPLEIESRINHNTRGIIAVHFAGHPCELKQIYDFAQNHQLLVIEDASHALGASYHGDRIGSCKFSDMAVFSFHPVKAITSGEGGMVITNSEKLYNDLLIYRNHGITKDAEEMGKSDGPWYYEMQKLGFNYRITDFQCALAINQFKKLDRFIQRRREIAAIYSDAFNNLSGFVQLPTVKPEVQSAYHIYVIRLKNGLERKRKMIFNDLQKHGLGVQVHYIPIHLQPYYREHFKFAPGQYPVAEDYYRRAITLPLFPRMSESDIQFVIEVFHEVITSYIT